jgi:hypothetical protein
LTFPVWLPPEVKCPIAREIEYEIEQLKSDLDEVKKKATRKYTAAKPAGRG